jgi:hypothetical protein
MSTIKLNHKQAMVINNFLWQNGFFSQWTYSANTLGELFDGEIIEARILSRFGMAGKIWNNNGRIYISGHNEAELNQLLSDAKKREINDIEMANRNIAAIIEEYK